MSEVETQQSGAVERLGANGALPAVAPRPAPDLESLHTQEKVGSLVIQARRDLRQGRREKAKKQLQEALTISPTDVHALEVLGDVFLEEAEQEKALKTFEYGLKHHPRHRPFEEKIALCIIDLKEMERSSNRKQKLELGDPDAWMNLVPGRAFGLSLLLPGAGHVYAEENEHAGWIFGLYLFSLLGWSIPLYMGLKNAAAMEIKGLSHGISYALSSMGGLALWFWPMLATCIGVHVYAMFDSMAAAERANERRKHGMDEL